MKIETKEQYDDVVAKIEAFIQKGFDNLTEAETTELGIISREAEEYENIIYPMPLLVDDKDCIDE